MTQDDYMVTRTYRHTWLAWAMCLCCFPKENQKRYAGDSLFLICLGKSGSFTKCVANQQYDMIYDIFDIFDIIWSSCTLSEYVAIFLLAQIESSREKNFLCCERSFSSIFFLAEFCNMSAHQLVINPTEIFLFLHSFIFSHFLFEVGLFLPLSDEFFPLSDEWVTVA